jgi:hypothetical protein
LEKHRIEQERWRTQVVKRQERKSEVDNKEEKGLSEELQLLCGTFR